MSAVVSVLKRSIELRVGVMRAHGHPSHLRSREAPRPASVHASVPLFLQSRHSATVTGPVAPVRCGGGASLRARGLARECALRVPVLARATARGLSVDCTATPRGERRPPFVYVLA